MRRFARGSVGFGLVLVAVAGLTLAADAGEKRLIGHGWDLLAVSPADVARNLEAWEKVPLDGVSLALSRPTPDGGRVGYGTIMNDPRWRREWFAEDVEALRRCGSGRLKHNFLTTFWAPGKRLAWDDDAAWATFAHNLGVMAWLAKAGGAKGILIDSEDYPESRQYLRAASDGPFEEAAARARERGAQVMRSMAAEYPGITLLSFWMLSLNPQYFLADDPRRAVVEADDLWPSFVNGMLAALPPRARLVDGNEHAYRYQAARNDFYLSTWRLQNKALTLVEPENRATYQTRMLAGSGLYLDAYVNEPDSPWYFGPVDGSRLNHLRLNVEQALDAASEYVWVYGEKHDWIRWKGTPRETGTTWDEALPGFHETLAMARDPRGWAAATLTRRHAEGKLENLLENGDCTLSAEARGNKPGYVSGALPPGWWKWQEETGPQGTFGTDVKPGPRGAHDSSLCAEGVKSGCFGASIPTAPGRRYLVEARLRGEGASVTVAWKRAGAWDWSLARAPIQADGAGPDGWRRAFGLVTVPEGADELVLMLNVRHDQDASQRTWFDRAGVYRVSPP